jgi:hypothetical protein
VTEWRPDEQLLSALHDAIRRADHQAYLETLLETSLVMPTDPARQQWAVVPADGDAAYVVAFSSVDALRESPAATAEQYIVWPVVDLLHAWPDPGWSLLVDGGLPTQAVLDPGVVAQLAEWAAQIYPLDAALRAAGTDPVAYIDALLTSEIVVPMAPEGSPSRDLSDPEFAWWRVAAGPDDGSGERSAAGIFLFSSPVRLQTRLGDVPWLQADFVNVLEHWPDGHAALVDPDHHIGAVLPADLMRRAAVWLRDTLWEAEEAARRVLGDDATGDADAERVWAALQAARQAVLRQRPTDMSATDVPAAGEPAAGGSNDGGSNDDVPVAGGPDAGRPAADKPDAGGSAPDEPDAGGSVAGEPPDR